MDAFTESHLRRWLDQYDDDEYRAQVERWIGAALLEDPEALDHGRSWPELRDAGRASEMVTCSETDQR